MTDPFDPEQARKEMAEILNYKMPFGKYKGRNITQLPIDYLIWFRRKGFPEGKLGRYLQIVLELKA